MGVIFQWTEPAAEESALISDAIRGLLTPRKSLPPKYFYDARGAALFERICETPEYYVTRAELEILERHVHSIANSVQTATTLVEYGSGAGVKVRHLLSALPRVDTYVPIDICDEQLGTVAQELQQRFPALAVSPLAADFTQRIVLPEAIRRRGPSIGYFPGSTIGNFEPLDAAALLSNIRETLGRDGAIVLGVDRRKSRRALEAAYNDQAGVTAAFNLNLLERLNREANADFDVSRFSHIAIWNESASRIEMHLVSEVAHTVRVNGVRVGFEAGESIVTEYSYKYDETRLARLASRAGLAVDRTWTDSAEQFWVALLRPV